MPLPEEFGQWTNVDERLMELNSRLLAWQLISDNIETDLTELFAAAQRHYQRSAADVLVQIKKDPEQVEQIVEAVSRGMLLEAFEQALNDMDEVRDVTLEIGEDG